MTPSVILGRRRQRGFVLLSVMMLVIVVITVSAAIFALASYETRGALYRQNSTEAFYLADGAVERARAKLLDDRSWRAGWQGEVAYTATGTTGGTYDLGVADTAIAGYDGTVKILATGHVKSAHRRIEVLAEVPPTASGLPMLIMGDAEVGGNLCLSGLAHINGDAAGNNGHGDPNFSCDGEFSEGFRITPPIIFTDPAHFPGATYYYVKGYRVGGSTYSARIFDENLVDVTGTTDMSTLTSYNSATKTYTFRFDSPARINLYFNDAGGKFSRAGGDSAVVVNFGELPLDPTGALYQALIIDGNASSNIHATIINSRFEGTSLSQRLRSSYWRGAKLEVKQCIFEPYFGIAMICHDLERTGSAQAYLGTSDYPALIYVTQDVITINSNLTVTGSLICLRDFHSTGGPDIVYDPGFIQGLPDYLREDWQPGTSGTLKVLNWREVGYSN